MLGAIKYCLTNIANFKGRDARSTFWFYVLFLVIVQYAMGLMIALPMMGTAVTGAFSAARDGVPQAQMQQQIMASMAGTMRTSMTMSAVISVLSALLLVAAFVRRLHDSSKPGWIAAIPFLLVVAGIGYSLSHIEPMLQAMANFDAEHPIDLAQAQRPLLLASAFSYLGYLIVIVFGAWPSTDGANAYGEEPELD